jgi:hypothetical protein
VGSLRYRIPAEAPMAIVAAAGALYRREHERAAASIDSPAAEA